MCDIKIVFFLICIELYHKVASLCKTIAINVHNALETVTNCYPGVAKSNYKETYVISHVFSHHYLVQLLAFKQTVPCNTSVVLSYNKLVLNSLGSLYAQKTSYKSFAPHANELKSTATYIYSAFSVAHCRRLRVNNISLADCILTLRKQV